jgi:4'-phosphopantetheinyl transferase
MFPPRRPSTVANVRRIDQVAVVRIRLDAMTSMPPAFIDETEQLRASRFVYERDRRSFVSAHSALRAIIGHVLSVPPGSIRFAAASHGKPILRDARFDLRFNLSRARERALVGLSIGREIGIDIEEECELNAIAVAEHAFSPAVRRKLKRLPAARRVGAFYQWWVRQESFIKARGGGLSFSLDSFDVNLANDGGPALPSRQMAPDDMKRWTIMPLSVEQGYCAALTIEGGPCDILYCDSVDSFIHHGRWPE